MSFVILGFIGREGVPEHLELDPSKPNLSNMLAEYCENRGIVMHHIAADAHWQLGKVERHGQWFQSIFKKVCDEHPPLSAEDFVERVSQTQQAKNSLISERGAIAHFNMCLVVIPLYQKTCCKRNPI